MRYRIMAMAFASVPFFTHAQVNTRGQTGTTDTVGRFVVPKDTVMHKLLLIPFEPKMCMLEIGKEVHAHTNLSFDEITAEFRKQLDLAMYAALRKIYVTISLLQSRRKSDSVLAYIYGSTGYQYDMVPGTTPDAGQAEHDPKNRQKNFIHNGQLQVPVDYSKRFMNVNITNPHLLADLNKKYHTDTFVFINELDINNVPNITAGNLNEDVYRRQVTVHYSIVNKNGKYISKGIATTYFPYKENDPKQIGLTYFSVIAHTILINYRSFLVSHTPLN